MGIKDGRGLGPNRGWYVDKEYIKLTVIKPLYVHISCLPRQENTKNQKNTFETIEGAGEVVLVCRAALTQYWYNVYLTFWTICIWKLEIF